MNNAYSGGAEIWGKASVGGGAQIWGKASGAGVPQICGKLASGGGVAEMVVIRVTIYGWHLLLLFILVR